MTALARWRAAARDVLGMNRRNVEYVQARNARRDFPLANDKLRTKEVLAAAGCAVSPTLATVSSFAELSQLRQLLAGVDSFVIKPARGSGGRGILVIARRAGNDFVTASGRLLRQDDLRRHIADVIFGVYSLDRADVALVEPRLIPAPFFAALYPDGLSDLRVITVDQRPVMAMLRVPTRASEGRANLHQGAIGLGVDLESGVIHRAWFRGRCVPTHPDTSEPLVGVQVPQWQALLTTAVKAAMALPLGYLGIDVVVDRERGPIVLEVNARPGLEIQNVNGIALGRRFAELRIG